MAIALALTTTFTPPPSCFTDVIRLGGVYSVLWNTALCLPIGWSVSGWFSPGICPKGFTTACSSLNVIQTLTETVATCCLSGYQCQKSPLFIYETTQHCVSRITTSATITAGFGTDSVTSTSVFTEIGGAINAYGIEVRWQSSDVNPTTTSRNSLSTTSSISTTGGSSTSTPLNPPGGGLSKGSKIGIGVSVSLVFLAVLLGLILFWRRHRHRSARNGASPGLQGLHLKPELEASELAHPPPHQSYSQPQIGIEPAELHANDLTSPSIPSPGANLQQLNTPEYMRQPDPSVPDGGATELEREMERIRIERQNILRLQELIDREREVERQIAKRT